MVRDAVSNTSQSRRKLDQILCTMHNHLLQNALLTPASLFLPILPHRHTAVNLCSAKKILGQHRTNGKIHRIAVVAERTLWITSELLFAKAH